MRQCPKVPVALAQLRQYGCAVLVTASCTALALPILPHVDLINVVMIYLLGAAVAGLLLGRGPSALAAFTNTLAFDYFFVPPRFSFLVLDSRYFVTFAAMLLVALIISNLMITIRHHTETVAARERHTAALYGIARVLAIAPNVETMISAAARHIDEVLTARCAVLLRDQRAGLLSPQFTGRGHQPLSVDREAADWVAQRGERAGPGTPQFGALRTSYTPLRGSRSVIGVLVVEPKAPFGLLAPEQQRLLEAIADQLALALERVRLADLAHAASLAAERAAMRNTLLASISHDLRTPLSAIAGAGSIVAQSDFVLDVYRRVTLGRLIEDKARDMSDLLTNVLELVRLESGSEVLSRDWHSLSDLVGLAIQRHESRLSGWQVITDVPADLPLLMVDSNLIVQLLSNLLENAVKYTPQGSRIRVFARRELAMIRLVVEDNGPGLGTAPDEMFEKFSRGRTEGNSGGIGLGLAICRTVARLHEGDICAMAGDSGGARFDITLPYVEEPVALETSESPA